MNEQVCYVFHLNEQVCYVFHLNEQVCNVFNVNKHICYTFNLNEQVRTLGLIIQNVLGMNFALWIVVLSNIPLSQLSLIKTYWAKSVGSLMKGKQWNISRKT